MNHVDIFYVLIQLPWLYSKETSETFGERLSRVHVFYEAVRF